MSWTPEVFYNIYILILKVWKDKRKVGILFFDLGCRWLLHAESYLLIISRVFWKETSVGIHAELSLIIISHVCFMKKRKPVHAKVKPASLAACMHRTGVKTNTRECSLWTEFACIWLKRIIQLVQNLHTKDYKIMIAGFLRGGEPLRRGGSGKPQSGLQRGGDGRL